MATYVRAVVDDEEKENTKKRAKELGLTESQLIRRGLKEMGVDIEVEKEVGAPIGNKNNPDGNKELFKASPTYKKSQRAKRDTGD